MKSRVPTAYFLVPVVYVLIIGFLVYLHFDSGEQSITEQIGPMQLEVISSGGIDREYELVRVSFFGFSLDVTEGIPAVGAGGAERRIPVSTIETTEKAIRISGDGGASLLFSIGHTLGAGVFEYPETYPTGSEQHGVRIDWKSPEKERNIRASFGLESLYEIERVSEGLNLFSARGERGSFLCASTGTHKTEKTGDLRIELAGNGEDTSSGCIVAPFEGEAPLMYWFFGDSSPRSEQEYRSLSGEWRNASYSGWTERYRPEESTWDRGQSGMSEFEVIMTAYAAETMSRRAETGLGEFSEAMDAFGGRHSFFSSPYLGNVVGNSEEYILQEEKTAETIRNFIAAGSPDLFVEEEHLISYFIWYGDDELIEDFNGYVESLEPSSVEDSAALAHLFAMGVEAEELYADRFPALVEKREEAYRELLGRIVRVEENPIFPAGEKKVETEVMLKLGLALMEYGKSEERSLAVDLGVDMAVQVLEKMDEQGFIPQTLRILSDSPKTQQGSIPPEILYSTIVDNSYYPRLVSLSDELNTDIRLWTVSRAVGAVRSADSISITLDFAVGETEYVVVRGVPPFDSFNLYGLRWGSDRRFQTYGVGGWFYDDERGTLFAKLRHQSKVERLEMVGLQ